MAVCGFPRSRVGDGALARLGDLWREGRLAALERLDLESCRITDAGLIAGLVAPGPIAAEPLEAACFSRNPLVDLNVARCRRISDVGLLAVFRGCDALETLHADECPRLTSAALSPLLEPRVAPRLATLSLRGLRSHRRVTLAAVGDVRAARPELTIHGQFAAVLYR